jgi:hypothetical protein
MKYDGQEEKAAVVMANGKVKRHGSNRNKALQSRVVVVMVCRRYQRWAIRE